MILFNNRITEFKYGMNLGDVVRKNNGQKLSYLQNFGEGWDFLSGLSALVFVDNHDNQRGHGAGGFSRILTFFEANMYKIATAFELAWPYGHVRLMSSYYWPRDIQVSSFPRTIRFVQLKRKHSNRIRNMSFEAKSVRGLSIMMPLFHK